MTSGRVRRTFNGVLLALALTALYAAGIFAVYGLCTLAVGG